MIKIICVGKIKEEFFKEAIKEYIKRLTKYTKVDLIEVNDYSLDSKEVVLSKEKNGILKHIQEKDYIVTLEIEGVEMDSITLSKKIDQLLSINPNLVFIIGGSYGIHEDLKKKSNLHLSFSKLTFPHQLFRILLLEQLYRSFKIIHGETYHK